MERSADRLEALRRIDEYERNGWFDRDIETDPPTIPLEWEKVDYTQEKLITRIEAYIADAIGYMFFERRMAKGELVISSVVGRENLLPPSVGAIVTCNHFNAFDNYAAFKAVEPSLRRKKLYRIIREGNYTSFPGLYGFFFRHCDTLPLCSSVKGLAKLKSSAETLLSRGEKILIYPEQGMWWNYRKPRPAKSGAFVFASAGGCPVQPLFITMKDGKKLGSDGFPIQEYTVHICRPIYPDPSLSARKNALAMAEMNFLEWKSIYESFYGTELTYLTEIKAAE